MEVDLRIVASRIVKDCMRLGKKDSLVVNATEHMLPLAKEIIKAARRAGADTAITLDSDDIWYDALLNLPLTWLKAPSALSQAVSKASTANVYLAGPEDPSKMRDIPSERWAANDEGARLTYEPLDKRPIPTLDLSISRVTQARALTYGFDYAQWFASTLQALGADPKVMGKKGERVAKVLSNAKKAKLTAPGGTRFEFEFHGSTPSVHTGEIRPKKGDKASYYASLPGGIVSIALKRGSGKGRVVSTSPIPQVGRMIRGLSWEFEGGRVRMVEAKENLDAFKTLFTEEKRRKGAGQLGWLEIGLNPAAAYGFLDNGIVEGVVTIGIGNNSDLGGNNKSGFRFAIFFKDATLEVDGKKVVVGGKIVA